MADGLRRFKKKNLASVDGLAAYLARPQAPPTPPAALRGQYAVTERTVEGFPVVSVSSHPAPAGALLLLHGGAYVAEITRPHWAFAGQLAGLGCRVDVPLYGLAPRHTYREAFPLITQAYRDLLAGYPPDRVALLGDSCGGGMALALAQSLDELSLPQPATLALLSPWLDLTLTNPAIPEVEQEDPWLGVPGLVAAGRYWAGGDDPAAPLTSPIHGRMAGLPPIFVLVGTHDLFLPDCRRLRDLAGAAGVAVRHEEAPGMFHTWMLADIPEGAAARRRIATALQAAGVLAASPGTG